MLQIQPTDEILATLRAAGRTISGIRISGVTTFDEALALISSQAPRAGLATIAMRNPSQGWSTSRNLYLR